MVAVSLCKTRIHIYRTIDNIVHNFFRFHKQTPSSALLSTTGTVGILNPKKTFAHVLDGYPPEMKIKIGVSPRFL